ncbi:MAG: YifB family Mg chelatase-like AAA ATPase [Deltaproteobacteria bacterium]|nr:YifB family Mg chelatase-like AAA ATPase [Deltaproteobacteria bacterium]
MARRLLRFAFMVAKIHASSLTGISAYGVQVEVDFTKGLPGLDIVGLAETVVRESRARVQTAIENSNYKLPHRRFIVNLAPADLPKSGASFDLAIAIALLSQCGICAPNRLDRTLILGELSLEGMLRPIRGLLAHLTAARQQGLEAAVIPDDDASSAALATGVTVYRARTLKEVVDFLNSVNTLPQVASRTPCTTLRKADEDMSDVFGQETAKRAIEVAACGMHNLILVGPPGAGKTMLARRLRGLLPPPTADEALQIATISGAAGSETRGRENDIKRPFRAPHHTISDAGLIGGGVPIRPGEVTLSHLGVLFLDEFPEFRRSAIESLRPIMESAVAVIVRAKERAIMPARPLVVAAMNPCPCGYFGDKKRICRCSPDQIQRYRSRISGPILDRFDIHVELSSVSPSRLQNRETGESSAVIAARVAEARERQQRREQREPEDRESACRNRYERLSEKLRPEAIRLLHLSIERLGLSLRAYHKVLRVGHTISNLAGHDFVEESDIAEAIQYRVLDRDPSNHAAAGSRFPSVPSATAANYSKSG